MATRKRSTKTPAATRRSKPRSTARAAGTGAPAAAAPASDAIAVGEVIDGWTVLAITNPTDVQLAQGAERRTVTLADLVRAKQQAAAQR